MTQGNYPNMQISVVINYISAKLGYWRNPVNYILVINASLHLCEEWFTAAILFDINYAISLFNLQRGSFDKLVMILLYTFEAFNICCRQTNVDHLVVTTLLIYRRWIWNTNVCWWKIIIMICSSWEMSIDFSLIFQCHARIQSIPAKVSRCIK